MTNNRVFIFTEIVNCAEIGYIMLKSFLKHHPNREINVYGTTSDFDGLNELNNNPLIVKHNIDNEYEIIERYKLGHRGSASIFAKAFKECSERYVTHIDSDIYFKKESLSLLEDAMNEGFNCAGSRRCYVKNPSGVKYNEGTPDSISTYFTIWDKTKINFNSYYHDTFVRMFEGAHNPLDFPILDFADGICFEIILNGGKIKFLDSNLIGGQDENGSKKNNYPLNMHMDNGKHLIHFGGVGSGLASFNGSSNPEKSYADWALGRWALFAKVFYNKDIPCPHETKYLGERWVFGNYDDNILSQVKEQLI